MSLSKGNHDWQTEVSGAKFDTLLKGIDEIIKLYLDLCSKKRD